MQGIFIGASRPKSKKEIKEQFETYGIAADVTLEATSLFGNEYGGPVHSAPDGTYSFVGPDPYTSRKFYGTIKKNGNVVKVS